MAFIDRLKYDGPPPLANGDAAPWLVYKFPSETLLLGSQLIVAQSQEAIFFKGGAAADVFGPGTHTLSSANLPLLHRIINLPFGGKTPFAAEVFFINKAAKLDMKWGTIDPFQVTDPKYQVIVKVRAFGQFGIKVADVRNLVSQIVGVMHEGTVSDYQSISRYFKGLVLTKVKSTVAATIVQKSVSLLDITSALDDLSIACRDKVTPEFERFGLSVLNFYIESINVPDEDLARLRKILEQRAEFDLLGDTRYAAMRSYDVMQTAAGNEGAAGAGLQAGLGIGMALGSVGPFATAMSTVSAPLISATSQPPSPSSQSESPDLPEFYCQKCSFANQPGVKFCGSCGERLVADRKTCTKCQFDNFPGTKFCGNCGASLLEKRCAKCNSENPPGTKFCGNCGQSLGGAL